MSHNYDKHSRDKYIVGGFFVIAMIIALYFVFSANLSNQPLDNSVASTTGATAITFDTGTSTATSSVASSTPTDPTDPKVILAKCLTAKGVKMYGAYWCENCKAEKDNFGPAFQFISYVECTQQTQLCLAKGINGYPTWIRADGNTLLGVHSLLDLATWSGCPYQVGAAN